MSDTTEVVERLRRVEAWRGPGENSHLAVTESVVHELRLVACGPEEWAHSRLAEWLEENPLEEGGTAYVLRVEDAIPATGADS